MRLPKYAENVAYYVIAIMLLAVIGAAFTAAAEYPWTAAALLAATIVVFGLRRAFWRT